MGVSENSGTPKSSILIGFSIFNHPFWGTPNFGNTHIEVFWYIIYNVHVGHHVWGRLMSRGLDLTSSIGLQSCDRCQGLTSSVFTL